MAMVPINSGHYYPGEPEVVSFDPDPDWFICEHPERPLPGHGSFGRALVHSSGPNDVQTCCARVLTILVRSGLVKAATHLYVRDLPVETIGEALDIHAQKVLGEDG